MPYKISLLYKKYRNYKYNRIKKCKPIDLPIPNFSKINNKILYLEEIEDKAAKAKEAIIATL